MIISEKEFDTQKIKKAFLTEIDMYDSDDPRSIRYLRKYDRPVIHWWHIIIVLLIKSSLLCTQFIVVEKLVNARFAIILLIISLLLFLVLFGKNDAITCIKIYQRYAPIEIRKRCRFEPSCSEYAIQAFEKYGFFKGISLTIKRLHKCNPSGGGFDYLQ